MTVRKHTLAYKHVSAYIYIYILYVDIRIHTYHTIPYHTIPYHTIQTCRHTDIHTGTDIQTCRHTDIQTYSHTYICIYTCLCFFRSLQQGSQFSPRAGTKVTSRELFTEATNSTRPAEKRLRAAERGTGRGRVAIRTVPPLYVYQPYTKHAARSQQAWSRSTAARLPHPEAARKGKS